MRDLARCFLFASLLPLSGGVWALGLGELRGEAVLGKGLNVSVELLGDDKRLPDASCFRLVAPVAGGDMPWLRKATFDVRQAKRPVVDIRTDAPIHDPVFKIALQVTCGNDLLREYTLLASPAIDGLAPQVVAPQATVSSPTVSRGAVPEPRRASPSTPAGGRPPVVMDAAISRRNPVPPVLPERQMLSGSAGEPYLRLATDLPLSARETQESQRDLLRLEFKMLLALHEQATAQLATTEKLRRMEGTLGELKQRAADFAVRVEKGEAAPSAPAAAPAAVPVAAPSQSVQLPSASDSDSSDWLLYAALFGGVIGLAGWLAWRGRREREQPQPETLLPAPELIVDPPRIHEAQEAEVPDLAFEPHPEVVSSVMDLDLEEMGEVPPIDSPTVTRAVAPHSIMSIDATSIDEHFEANPVVELAEIMLSFGRVKGAAQALQEYIDTNPQEALQPWVRLLEIYRMAGMRQEFEAAAQNLKQHFNVAVQQWESPSTLLTGAVVPEVSASAGLEDFERLTNMVVKLWPDGDVVGYLTLLLRDNRGGDRQGFPMGVVEDIMFLIELKEVCRLMYAK